MPVSKTEFQKYLATLPSRIKEEKKSKEIDSYHASMSGKDKDALVKRTHRSFWQLFRAFWQLLASYQTKIYLGLASLTISTLLALLPPLGTKVAIDSALTNPPAPLPTSSHDGLVLLNRSHC